MKKTALIVILVEVFIGILTQIMPDSIQNFFIDIARLLHISQLMLWIILILVSILILYAINLFKSKTDKDAIDNRKQDKENEAKNNASIEGDNNKVYQNVNGDIKTQTHYGTGDNIGRDKIIYNIQSEKKPLPKRLTNKIPAIKKTEIIGRVNFLEELHKLLFKNKPVVVVNGLGGIGKTTVAQTYVGEYYDEYKHLIWIFQASGKSIIETFAEEYSLRKNLDVPDNIDDYEQVFYEIIRRLNQVEDKPNLLVIDNADASVEKIKDQLPDPDKWHVLITSRIALNDFVLKELDFLSPDEAFKLFKTNYNKNNLTDEQIRKIINAVDYHTLTIEILSKTANVIEYDFDELIKFLEQDIEIDLRNVRHSQDKKLEKINNYLTEVFKLAKLDDEEIWLMKNFACLPSDFIDYDTLKDLLVDKEFKKLRFILDNLQSKGWLIKRDNSYKMHLIIAEIVKKQVSIEFEDVLHLALRLADRLSYEKLTDRLTDKLEWTVFADSFASVFADNKPDNPKYLSILSQIYFKAAYIYQKNNQFNKALPLYQEALEIYRSFANENPRAYLPDVATTLNNLAALHSYRNEFQDAEEKYQEALEIHRSLANENPIAYLPYVATTLNNLGNLLSYRNEFQDAEEKYQEALEIYRSLANENPRAYLPYVATTLNNLAALHQRRNEFQDAEEKYQEALEIYRSLDNENPRAYLPDVATTLNNLAVLHYTRNEFQDAEEKYQEALEIYRSLANENPRAYLPYVATTLNNLAALHQRRNEFQDAEEKYQEALEIRRSLANENPRAYLPDVAMTLNNLAVLHYTRNEFQDAEEKYQEALEIRRSLANENPRAYLPDVATTLISLAIFYLQAVPDREKSVRMAKEVLEIATLFPEHYMVQQYAKIALQVLAANGISLEDLLKGLLDYL